MHSAVLTVLAALTTLFAAMLFTFGSRHVSLNDSERQTYKDFEDLVDGSQENGGITVKQFEFRKEQIFHQLQSLKNGMIVLFGQ